MFFGLLLLRAEATARGEGGGAKLQVNCKFRHIKTLFFDHQNSVKTYPKSRKWHFRDSKFKNFFGPLAFVLSPQSKRDSYGTACFCNTSVRKICVFLFVNCVFIFRIANTFLALYVMKYSEIFFVIRKFLAYTPTIHASSGPAPPPRPRRQHFRETFFRCPFHFKSAYRNQGPPNF